MPMGASFVEEARRTLLLMFFCCFFVLGSQRINMSIAIISMVKWSAVYENSSVICPGVDPSALNFEEGKYVWSPIMQAQVLASYCYGLVLVQLPAEMLVERFSAHYIALIGTVLSSVCTYVTPAVTEWNIGGLIYVQMTKAMGHALVIPAFSIMTGQWIPTKQLLRFIATATCGIPTGASVTVLLGGILYYYPKLNWPYIFYISGVLGFIWCVLWLYLCVNFHFLPVLSSSRTLENFPNKDLPVPLKQILTSKPFWGYVCAGVASYWMIALNIFILPIYVRLAFGLSLEWNALMSSFPNVLQAFLHLLSFGILRKKTTDKTTLRRLTACIGMSIFATCMVLMTFVLCKRSLGIILMVIAIGASGFNIATLSFIPVDMSPNFAGVMAGIMNTIGSFTASGLPLMMGYFLSDEREIRDWNKVFYACAFVTFISMILFMAYSSCEIQAWNNPADNTPSIFNAISSRSLLRSTSLLDALPSSSSNLLEDNREFSTAKQKKKSRT